MNEAPGGDSVFLNVPFFYDSRSSSCTFKSLNVRRTRHLSRRPGKFPSGSPQSIPTAATCVMSARSATRPGLNILLNEFQMVESLEAHFIYLLGSWNKPIYGTGTCLISDFQVPHVFLSTFENYSTTISPRFDCDVPSLHF